MLPFLLKTWSVSGDLIHFKRRLKLAAPDSDREAQPAKLGIKKAPDKYTRNFLKFKY